jgi:hypothetical protein
MKKTGLIFALLMPVYAMSMWDKMGDLLFGKPIHENACMQQAFDCTKKDFFFRLLFVKYWNQGNGTFQALYKTYHDANSDFIKSVAAEHAPSKLLSFTVGGLVGISTFVGLSLCQVKSAGELAVKTGGITATIVHGSMYANQVHQERPFRQFQQEILKIYQRVNSTEHIKRRVEEPEIRMPEL